jgi:hypothetical protein
MEIIIPLIAEELYGTNASTVCRTLAHHGKSKFKHLLTYTQLKPDDLRASLLLLIQQNLVGYLELASPHYYLEEKELLNRIRYPRYMRLAINKFGNHGIIEEVLENGSLRPGQILENLMDGRRRVDMKKVENGIKEMISAGYLIPVENKGDISTFLHEDPAKPRKKRKLEEGKEEAKEEVFYRMNTKLMNSELASAVIGGLVSRKNTNSIAAVVAETLYKAAKDKEVRKEDLFKELPSIPKISQASFDNYLDKLEKEEFLILHADEKISLNMSYIRRILWESSLEKIIRGRFGEFHSRVFKVLCRKGMLNEKSISELSLLPVRETRVCINELFVGGILNLQEIPNRDVYYSIKLEDIKTEASDRCLQGIVNLRLRLKAEMEDAIQLMQRIGTLSTEEKQQIERYKVIETRIESAILELDRTLLILNEI